MNAAIRSHEGASRAGRCGLVDAVVASHALAALLALATLLPVPSRLLFPHPRSNSFSAAHSLCSPIGKAEQVGVRQSDRPAPRFFLAYILTGTSVLLSSPKQLSAPPSKMPLIMQSLKTSARPTLRSLLNNKSSNLNRNFHASSINMTIKT